MSVIAFLQARMSSSRLPGKVLLDLAGSPMLIQQINRLKRSKLIDDIVVLTSNHPSDDPLVKICDKYGIKYFRGDLDNVLNRFYQAYLEYNPDHIVRITGDCPLLDWKVVDQTIQQHLDYPRDLTSNTCTPSFPDGLDVEVMTKECLIAINNKASSKTEIEHVTYYCYTHEHEFSMQNVENELGDQSGFRWTVDTPEDFEVVSEIYNSLFCDNQEFTSGDIFKFLNNNPRIRAINSFINRNEGLEASIRSESDYE